MLERHYAPRARLFPFAAADEAAVQAALEDCRTSGGKAAAMVRGPVPAGIALAITLPGNPSGYARGLYDALHRLDEAGATLILVEQPPGGSEWDGIRDRLERAARP
jgi:L-threonylcarbamoyladenylate synthase